MASELRILLSDPILQNEENTAGTLFLLPPQGESGLSLVTETEIPAICSAYRIAVVIPPCLQGCFTDMVYGYPFYQSLKYVREYLRHYFPGIPLEHGKCAVAGIGISAVAALSWAAEEPEGFACAAPIGGILDPAMAPHGWFTEKRLADLFGTPEERLQKREKVLKIRAGLDPKKIFLSSSEEDPITLKACSEQLEKFIKFWIGGDR